MVKELVKAKLVRELPSYGHEFDTTICRTCPFGAYRAAETYYPGLCLRPEHYDQLTCEAEQAREREVAAAVARAKEQGKTEVLPLSKLQWGTYERLDRHFPAGCLESCPDRTAAIDHDRRVVPVCLKPACFRRLTMAVSRAEGKERRQVVKTAQEALIEHLDGLQAVGSRELAVIVHEVLANNVPLAILRDVVAKRAPQVVIDGTSHIARIEREDLARLDPLTLVQTRRRRVVAREPEFQGTGWLPGSSVRLVCSIRGHGRADVSARKRQPNKDFVAIAEQLAAELAAKLEAAGYPVDMQRYIDIGPLLTAAFSHLVGEREKVANEAKKVRRDAWVAERGLLTWEQAQERLRLSGQELHAALDLEIVRSVEVPTEVVGYAFMRDRVIEAHELTPAEREQIAENVFLTRNQAAARLGITPARFDTLRKKAGLQHVRTERGENGWPLYLYRQCDVDHLRMELKA